MNNTILTDRQKLALDKLINYSMPAERTSLEEYLSDELGEDEIPSNLSEMTDDALYEFIQTDESIDHIWVELYLLSKV